MYESVILYIPQFQGMTDSKEFVAEVEERKSSLVTTEQRNSGHPHVYCNQLKVWNEEEYCEADNKASNE